MNAAKSSTAIRGMMTVPFWSPFIVDAVRASTCHWFRCGRSWD